uniref:Uncharacterized protein n=1 Tax=Arundo donax TaxID=35708 RepID=A0A0A9HB63_ARUDO
MKCHNHILFQILILTGATDGFVILLPLM